MAEQEREGRLKRAERVAVGALGAVVAFVTSAVLWLLLIALCGAGLLVYGVDLLAGRGPACIVAGLMLMAFAVLIARGMRSNG